VFAGQFVQAVLRYGVAGRPDQKGSTGAPSIYFGGRSSFDSR
jgi:hypothetical protein